MFKLSKILIRPCGPRPVQVQVCTKQIYKQIFFEHSSMEGHRENDHRQYLQRHIHCKQEFQRQYAAVLKKLRYFEMVIKNVCYNCSGPGDFQFADKVDVILQSIHLQPTTSLVEKTQYLTNLLQDLEYRTKSISHMELYRDARWRDKCDI